jgi:WD40 repeat protein
MHLSITLLVRYLQHYPSASLATETLPLPVPGWLRWYSSSSRQSNCLHLCTQQVLLTAGWDQTVQIWDMREGKSVRSIFGAYVCGDALDVKGGRVLTGSWRHTNPLQVSSCELCSFLP